MTKKVIDEVIESFDIGKIFTGNKSDDTDKSFETALSEGLLFALQQFNKSSDISNRDAKLLSILEVCNPTIAQIIGKYFENRKDSKRKRSKEWIQVIKSITSGINQKEFEKSSMLGQFFNRNR